MKFSPVPPGTEAAPDTSLAPRLIKGMQADYAPEHWPGENTSGLKVYGKNVLVKMDSCSRLTSGGIHLTDELAERMDEASTTGCIYALGPEAFHQFDDGLRWTGDKPAVGERIYVEKFAGIKARGRDGGFYRIMDYRNVAAGLTGHNEGVEA